MAGTTSGFPDVILPSAYVAQTEYSSADVKVLQIADSPEQKTLNAYVQLGDNTSFKYWVPVQSGDAYSVNWTNQDVSNAIVAYFTPATQAPAA
jgi:hypothetical protein